MTWLVGLLDRACVVLGALICAQTPMFIQQYAQQLSGRVAELKLQVDAIAGSAMQGQKTIPQLIKKFMDNADPDFVRQGHLMKWSVSRYEELSEALNQLTSASIYSKPFIFLRDVNAEVFETTFNHFQFGIPFSLEGVIYALIGIGMGYSFFSLLRVGVNKVLNKVLNLKLRRVENDR